MDGHLGKGQGVEMAGDIVGKHDFVSGNWIFGESPRPPEFSEVLFRVIFLICLDFFFDVEFLQSKSH